MTVFAHGSPKLADDLACAVCDRDTGAPESLELAGELTALTRHLVLCPDCRTEEPELGGQG